MGIFTKKRGYTDGSRVASWGEVSDTLAIAGGRSARGRADNKYTLLTAPQLKALVFKYHDPSQLLGNTDTGFPDCDDFATIARGEVLKGATAEWFKENVSDKLPGPAWGVIRYKPRGGRLHDANFAVDSSSKVWVYEPQKRTWSGLEDVEHIADVDY